MQQKNELILLPYKRDDDYLVVFTETVTGLSDPLIVKDMLVILRA